MASDLTSSKEDALEEENTVLRELLAQAGLDAARLLAQAGIDATQQRASERLQRLLLEELHHRMKNTVATVMAIASQTLRTAESLAQGRQAIESRLSALGRAHDFLLQTNWEIASLSDVVRAAIEPYDTKGGGRFMVQDANIEIGSGAVLSFTMALNELCTNAVKYGALSNDTGHVEITSTLDEALQRFKLTWAEKGGPAVQKSTRRSFGTRLIDRLADQLRGDVRWRFEPTGVVCELDAPLISLQALHSN
jgi:two-component sensor histidine kinase